MEAIEKIKMFNNVFAPKKNEKIIILIDIPHEDIIDSLVWKERRKMAKEWFNIFKKMSNKNCYSVDLLQYKATGLNNSPIPKEIYNTVKEFNLVIAMTEFSASSSLINICTNLSKITRCVSMPMVEKRMEKTAFRANYKDVQIYANNIKKMLTKAIGADVLFSTGDKLFIDLRNSVISM